MTEGRSAIEIHRGGCVQGLGANLEAEPIRKEPWLDLRESFAGKRHGLSICNEIDCLWLLVKLPEHETLDSFRHFAIKIPKRITHASMPIRVRNDLESCGAE